MIELINVRKRFGDRWITNGVCLKAPQGKMTCVIGRSGEGKSVLLKQIIGLIKPTSGEVVIDGTSVTNMSEQGLQEIFRNCSYVFQFAALLDYLTVGENVAMPLTEQGIPLSDVMPRVAEKLTLVNLNLEIISKYPCELSGGMRKRVGIARALMCNPRVILYDEPTTGLDPINTRTVHELMYKMQHECGVTSLVISHDSEIFKYADYVALLHDGVIKFFGAAQDIWESDNPYIYQFIRGISHGPIAT